MPLPAYFGVPNSPMLELKSMRWQVGVAWPAAQLLPEMGATLKGCVTYGDMWQVVGVGNRCRGPTARPTSAWFPDGKDAIPPLPFYCPRGQLGPTARHPTTRQVSVLSLDDTCLSD